MLSMFLGVDHNFMKTPHYLFINQVIDEVEPQLIFFTEAMLDDEEIHQKEKTKKK